MIRRIIWIAAGGLIAACGEEQPLDEEWLSREPPPVRTYDHGAPPPGCGYGSGGYGVDCEEPEVDCVEDPCVHGRCVTEDALGRCACDEGYAGALCERCATGFHPEGLRCVTDGGTEP